MENMKYWHQQVGTPALFDPKIYETPKPNTSCWSTDVKCAN